MFAAITENELAQCKLIDETLVCKRALVRKTFTCLSALFTNKREFFKLCNFVIHENIPEFAIQSGENAVLLFSPKEIIVDISCKSNISQKVIPAKTLKKLSLEEHCQLSSSNHVFRPSTTLKLKSLYISRPLDIGIEDWLYANTSPDDMVAAFQKLTALESSYQKWPVHRTRDASEIRAHILRSESQELSVSEYISICTICAGILMVIVNIIMLACICKEAKRGSRNRKTRKVLQSTLGDPFPTKNDTFLERCVDCNKWAPFPQHRHYCKKKDAIEGWKVANRLRQQAFPFLKRRSSVPSDAKPDGDSCWSAN
jgi:hypothetical protein